MASYEVWLRRDDGQAIALIENWSLLQYALLTNDVSACRLVLPGTFDKTLLAPDRRLEIWRAPEGGARQREGIWLIRHRKDWTDSEGERRIEVTGYSPNYLLGSRIVAYAANSTGSKKTDYLDDMMKAVVLQNLSTGATSTGRQLSTTYLQIQPDLSAAPSRKKGFAWRNVKNVIKDLADTSKGAGTELIFDVVPIDSIKFEFRTYTGQKGIDHTYPDGNPPILLGLEFGNLAEPSLEEDWSEEVTYAYALGHGEESGRGVAEKEDAARSGRSIFGRREGTIDARTAVTDSTGLTAAAEKRLGEGKPRIRFEGRIVDTPSCRYGIHWQHGDKVTATYYGQSYDCLIRTIEVWIDKDGQETISSRLEAEE